MIRTMFICISRVYYYICVCIHMYASKTAAVTNCKGACTHPQYACIARCTDLLCIIHCVIIVASLLILMNLYGSPWLFAGNVLLLVTCVYIGWLIVALLFTLFTLNVYSDCRQWVLTVYPVLTVHLDWLCTIYCSHWMFILNVYIGCLHWMLAWIDLIIICCLFVFTMIAHDMLYCNCCYVELYMHIHNAWMRVS